ncbi:MAG TPA: hypothetical protein VM012_15185 [Flavitalea sp.]|nr:hypothetical protein [Flavitalea sp.]
MKRIYTSAGLLLFSLFLSQFTFSQTSDQIKYCQISASSGPDDDAVVEKFLFGFQNQHYADSLMDVFKAQYGIRKRKNLYVTDALNFLSTLGWEFHSVYIVTSHRSVWADYYYVMKRK